MLNTHQTMNMQDVSHGGCSWRSRHDSSALEPKNTQHHEHNQKDYKKSANQTLQMKEQYSPRLEPPLPANLPLEAPTEEEEPKDIEGTR